MFSKRGSDVKLTRTSDSKSSSYKSSKKGDSRKEDSRKEKDKTKTSKSGKVDKEKPREALIKYDFLDNLSEESINMLAKLLRMPPGLAIKDPPSGWLATQAKGVKALPREVRPRNLVLRGAMFLSDRYRDMNMLPQPAILCRAHRGVDAWLVRQVFVRVGTETAQWADPIRATRGPARGRCVDDWLARMSAMSRLWLDAEGFRMAFGHDQVVMKYAGEYETVASRCEACTLAVIGARPQTLIDLRAGMASRSTPDRGSLRKLIKAWVAQFEGEQALAMEESIYKLSKVLKKARNEAAGIVSSSKMTTTTTTTTTAAKVAAALLLPAIEEVTEGVSKLKIVAVAAAASSSTGSPRPAADQAKRVKVEEEEEAAAATGGGVGEYYCGPSGMAEWLAAQSKSKLDLAVLDDMIHPALGRDASRRQSHVSATVRPLKVRKFKDEAGEDVVAIGAFDDPDDDAWTDCTAHTLAPSHCSMSTISSATSATTRTDGIDEDEDEYNGHDAQSHRSKKSRVPSVLSSGSTRSGREAPSGWSDVFGDGRRGVGGKGTSWLRPI